MGRGRAKAKQTKVARDLKYNTGNTDLAALQAELGGSSSIPNADDDSFAGEEFTHQDPYAKYYEDEDLEDELSGDDED